MSATTVSGLLETDITGPSQKLLAAINHTIDGKIKPHGALGELEGLGRKLCLVQGTLRPMVQRPTILVFAGDHGITEMGISAYPRHVTAAMVRNFLDGGAAINVFARLHDIELVIVDAGVAESLVSHPALVDAKVAFGTANFVNGPAMTMQQCEHAMERGAALLDRVVDGGANVVGCGEMGIGNSTAAAAIMSMICGLPVDLCVGRGSGVDDDGLQRKIAVIEQARRHYAGSNEPLEVLAHFGGFELAMICGASIRAAQRRVTNLVDGYCATAAILVAAAIQPKVLEYCVFAHQSAEPGHALMLKYLSVTPLLRLGMRLGEGTGCAVAVPLLRSACAFLTEMASFESAGLVRTERQS